MDNKLKQTIIRFFKEDKITSEEDIHQDDRVIENAYGLLGELFNLVKEDLKDPCDSCSKKIIHKEYITLYGTDDFYDLQVCEECYNKLLDCYTPEQVDKLMKKEEFSELLLG